MPCRSIRTWRPKAAARFPVERGMKCPNALSSPPSFAICKSVFKKLCWVDDLG
jgi:hypothetical protein